MKVLVITHKPSFPKVDGGCVATAQLITGLESSGIDFKIASIVTPKHPFKKEAFPENIQAKIAAHQFIDTSNKINTIKLWFLSKRSLFLERFYSPTFENKLVELCRIYQPDVIQFESLFAAIYLPKLKQISQAKMVIRSHNIEHQLWLDRLKKSSLLKWKLLRNQVACLKIDELNLFNQADAIAVISKDELAFLKEIQYTKPTVYLPTGIARQSKQSSYAGSFFILSAMDWQPNRDGLNWFLKKVWSKFTISEQLHVAGKSLDQKEYKNYTRLKNHGMIAESDTFMCENGIMIVPLFEGSGLRIKIIEAGILGVPIIATKKAVEGLGMVHRKEYWEANSALDFQNAMTLLMNDVSLRRNLGSEARAFMQENFDPELLNKTLIEFYKNIQ